MASVVSPCGRVSWRVLLSRRRLRGLVRDCLSGVLSEIDVCIWHLRHALDAGVASDLAACGLDGAILELIPSLWEPC